jgi:hypothetical protein
MGDNPASPHGGAQEDLMARVDTSVPVSAYAGIGRKP